MKTLVLLSIVCLAACSSTDPAVDGDPGGSQPASPGGKADSPSADGGEACSASGDAASVLELVNAARAEARDCGTESMKPAPKLYFDCRLEAAAKRHALDMAENGFFAHEGSDGSTVKERVTDAGFTWWTVGENIAAGQPDPASVMQSWLESPGHCKNIMKPDFGYFGAAHVTEPTSKYQEYWVQVFAGY